MRISTRAFSCWYYVGGNLNVWSGGGVRGSRHEVFCLSKGLVTSIPSLLRHRYPRSMLQCLVATESLSTYFRNLAWKNEVNQDNPLGMGGKVAEAYAGLNDDVSDA